MKRLFTLLTCITLFGGVSQGQYCTPNANCNGDDYIDNFTFNTISNLASAGSNCASNSYVNTSLSTTVTQGQKYFMTVQSGPLWAEGFGIWIDFNQNNNFSDPGEFVYQSPGASTAQFSDSVLIPVTALSGTTRMRVRCKFQATVSSGESCSVFNFGETEDYDVVIQAATIPPIAGFTGNPLTTCNGIVDFFDNSTGGTPTTWKWYFGDGDSSSVQNPSHTYLLPGSYDVTLIVCNAFGCDTLTVINYITVSSGGPVAASCTPTTVGYCCGFGITEVQFNTINQISPDASVGYEDHTCNQTFVLEGQSYPIFVRVDNPAAHNVTGWIDFDNDGTFNPVTEEIFSESQVLTVNTTVNVPTGAVLSQPLRMRISADFWQDPQPTPCSNPNVGQAEDYTVFILPNNNPPVSDFSVDDTISCDGQVCFTDLSQNTPTFFFWQFGDGNTSTLPNPCHTYVQDSTYTVTLITSNANGSDTIIMTNLVTVNLAGALTPTCNVITQAYLPDYGIYSVEFDSPPQFSNGTDGDDGYQDYSCSNVATVIESNSYFIEVRTGLTNPEDVNVWIDYDDDGVLNPVTELAFQSLNTTIHQGMIAIPTGAVLNTPLRMRINADFVGANNGPCDNSLWSQVEDYGIIITPNPTPPLAAIGADSLTTCDGTVQFFDMSTGGSPTSWMWYFGDGGTDTVPNPVYTYAVTGTYNVTLVVTNVWGTDSITYNNYIIFDTLICTATILPLVGQGPTQTECNGILYDNGGPAGNYSNNTTSSITIAPPGATQLSLDFTSLDVDNNWDWIYVYDGPTTGAPLIASITGFTLPATIMTSGGSATIEMVADPIINGAGFAMTWNCSYVPVPPVANFAADSLVDCDGTINFTDLSSGNPSSWTWDFGDGSPTSSLQNPTHTYSNPGNYTVTLIATNVAGTDTLVLTSYIVFDPSACAVYNMPTSGTTNYTSCGGTMFDDGGQFGNYSANVNSIVVLAPPSATQLTIDFPFFDFRTNPPGDTLYIYDGPTIASPLIGKWTGNFGPPATIFTLGGTATIQMISDGNAQDPGFEMTWSCTTAPMAPTANIAADSINDCDGDIQFTDMSGGNPTSWLWDFGDSNTSSSQHPSHTYSGSGSYLVTLIATNSLGSDTTTLLVIVDPGFCTIVTMPFTGTGTTQTGCVGSIYDSGGPSANYQDNSNSTLTIDPSTGQDLTLTFTMFDFEPGFDYLQIWDGPTAAAPSVMIGQYDGTGLPNGGSVISTMGALTLVQSSDFSVNEAGFAATWTCGTGINDKDQLGRLAIFPNPTSGLLNVNYEFEGMRDLDISLTNVMGQIVFNDNSKDVMNYKKQIDLGDQANGIYLLSIQDGENRIVRRVVVN